MFEILDEMIQAVKLYDCQTREQQLREEVKYLLSQDWEIK